MDLDLLIANPECAEVGPVRSDAESKFIWSIQCCWHHSAKHSSAIPHLIEYRVSVDILMLRPDFLPCYLLKGLSEMRYEDCTLLEHPDHQRIGIMPTEITEVWEKNHCVCFLVSWRLYQSPEQLPLRTQFWLWTRAMQRHRHLIKQCVCFTCLAV